MIFSYFRRNIGTILEYTVCHCEAWAIFHRVELLLGKKYFSELFDVSFDKPIFHMCTVTLTVHEECTSYLAQLPAFIVSKVETQPHFKWILFHVHFAEFRAS